jgi:hypothetical protein
LTKEYCGESIKEYEIGSERKVENLKARYSLSGLDVDDLRRYDKSEINLE